MCVLASCSHEYGVSRKGLGHIYRGDCLLNWAILFSIAVVTTVRDGSILAHFLGNNANKSPQERPREHSIEVSEGHT